MRLALGQPKDCWESVEHARAALQVLLDAAAQAAADIVVLPELSTISYDFGTRDDVAPHAERLDGPTVEGWHRSAAATGMTIVGGIPELGSDGRLYNSAVVVDGSGLRGVYRKAHLYDREREVFAGGDEPVGVVATDHGPLGVLICYDLRFVEATRIAALHGCRLICVPTTWSTRGKPRPWDDRGWCGQNYLMAGQAFANQLWIAAADRAGRDGQTRALGCSALMGPDGYAVAGPASSEDAALVLGEIGDLTSRPIGPADVLAHRRPELYGELVTPTTPEGEPRA